MTTLLGKVVAIASLVTACGCAAATDTAAGPTAPASPSAPSSVPTSYGDDRLAGLDTAVTDHRLTRPIALTDDTTMSVPTTSPVTPEGSVLDAVAKAKEFNLLHGVQPQLVFCALTTETDGTIGAGNAVTRGYVDRPVWALVYHDILEDGNAHSIPPVGQPHGPIDKGPLVDANVVAFVDDATGRFLFATDDSIRRPT